MADDYCVPHIGSRTTVQLFAGDVLKHQGLVKVEHYESSGYSSVVLDDGSGGLKVALTGSPAQLREVLEAALQAIDPDPEPPAVAA